MTGGFLGRVGQVIGRVSGNGVNRTLKDVSQVGVRHYSSRANSIRTSLEVELRNAPLKPTYLSQLSMAASAHGSSASGKNRVETICDAVTKVIPAFERTRPKRLENDFQYAIVRTRAIVFSCVLEMLDQKSVDLASPIYSESISQQMRRVVNLACPGNLTLDIEELDRVSKLCDRLTADLVDYSVAAYYAEFLERVRDSLCTKGAQFDWASANGRARLVKPFCDEIDFVGKRSGLKGLARDMERTVDNAISFALNQFHSDHPVISPDADVPQAGELSMRAAITGADAARNTATHGLSS